MSRYVVRDPAQLELLASPMRLQIVTAAAELGTCSIAEIAAHLGVAADSLYYHVRKLAKAGLLVSKGRRSGTGRDKEQFRAAGTELRLDYDLADPRAAQAIRNATAALLRSAQRDFERGTRDPHARVRGPARNLASGRATAWLSRDQLRELNALLARIQELLARTPPAPGKQMHAFSFTLAPIEPRER